MQITLCKVNVNTFLCSYTSLYIRYVNHVSQKCINHHCLSTSNNTRLLQKDYIECEHCILKNGLATYISVYKMIRCLCLDKFVKLSITSPLRLYAFFNLWDVCTIICTCIQSNITMYTAFKGLQCRETSVASTF